MPIVVAIMMGRSLTGSEARAVTGIAVAIASSTQIFQAGPRRVPGMVTMRLGVYW